jgi:hypothetical protein
MNRLMNDTLLHPWVTHYATELHKVTKYLKSVHKVKVKLHPEQATKAPKGSRGLPFFHLGARWRCVVNATPRPI